MNHLSPTSATKSNSYFFFVPPNKILEAFIFFLSPFLLSEHFHQLFLKEKKLELLRLTQPHNSLTQPHSFCQNFFSCVWRLHLAIYSDHNEYMIEGILKFSKEQYLEKSDNGFICCLFQSHTLMVHLKTNAMHLLEQNFIIYAFEYSLIVYYRQMILLLYFINLGRSVTLFCFEKLKSCCNCHIIYTEMA